MKIYTIGFTQKSAKDFFDVIKRNDIDLLIDIRLNNRSQLAGFAKGRDLEYFLNEICKVNYVYDPTFAPTKELLDNWKKRNIGWEEYERQYIDILNTRGVDGYFSKSYQNNNVICLLCSEKEPDFCHRRLLAEYLISNCDNLSSSEIVHI